MRKCEAKTAKARRIDVLAGLTRDLIFIFMMGIYYDRKQMRIWEHISILPDRFQMEGQEHAIALSRRQFGRRKALIEPNLK